MLWEKAFDLLHPEKENTKMANKKTLDDRIKELDAKKQKLELAKQIRDLREKQKKLK